MWRTKTFTPIFNTPDFDTKMSLNGGIDNSFHNRILETILFPKRAVFLTAEGEDIVSIRSLDYEKNSRWYTYRCFLERGEQAEKAALPSKKVILERLQNFPKLPYLLGGTIPEPIFLELSLSSDPFENRHKRLFGIDCSGLLHYVTNGYTPRNTSGLMKFGKKVETLQSLDLILFPGHVIIYLGGGLCIESREIDGVIISRWQLRKQAIKGPYSFIRWFG
ncbi:MAG: hypothetical protein SP4CHLAM5_04320 [Chlamydiia bacterium]|nr:hypothetical protein [Chlamydiia bacterium]MCH9618305.1 hypothetical protein [Chlamydiia bacterium]MCH9624178.1 hypothetical protein [Chlamydiia bacterium]